MSFARWRHAASRTTALKSPLVTMQHFQLLGSLRLPMGEVEGMYLRPKDSNAAVGVHDRATGKALEGADRQTDRLYVHYSKISQMPVHTKKSVVGNNVFAVASFCYCCY